MEGTSFGILVHCHLRWDFVWQRPQHIVSRLAERVPILFFEDPLPLPDGEIVPRLQIRQVAENVHVAQALLHRWTGDPAQDEQVHRKNAVAGREIIDAAVANLGWPGLVHWVYTPMQGHRVERYNPQAVVYDCMDELANFKFAPAELKEREAELMRQSDLVFTGGPSMYQARKDKHPRVYQFNSGVDTAHFAMAQDAETVVPADVAGLPHPVLLYYGVIDERMGWDNLAAVCDAHPDWSLAMVGPLAKIGEEDLLRRPNLHYLGQRSYTDLPGYLKGCDVALVPFALSDATRFLSPTKTLEYFAAGKPVVSTPIQDIVDNYADAARIAHTPQEFVAQCEAAMGQGDENRDRIARGRSYADAQTWDKIVDSMWGLLTEAVGRELSR